MYFGSGASLEQHLDTIEARVRPETQVVVLRLKRARNPDAVGMSLLENFVDRLQARGVHVILCGVQKAMLSCMQKCGLAEKLDPAHVFLEQPVKQTSTVLAIRYAYDLLTDFCATARAATASRGPCTTRSRSARWLTADGRAGRRAPARRTDDPAAIEARRLTDNLTCTDCRV